MKRHQTRRAPRTLDRATRTVEAVAATEAVTDMGGYREQLRMDGADLSHLVGAPVLDTHDQSSLEKMLGHVVAVRLEAGELVTTLRLNGRAEPYLEEIAEGALHSVSIGYSVQEWTETRADDGAIVRVATRWTPLEVSLVPLPADPGAQLRSLRMENEETAERALSEYAFPEDLPEGFYWKPTIGNDGTVTYAATEIPAEESRSGRVIEIQRRQAVTPLRASVGRSADDPAVINPLIAEALFARTNPRHQLSEPARAYAGLSMVEHGRGFLRRAGQSVSGLGASSIITRSLNTTSDFAIVLGDAVGRTLREAYGTAPSGVQTLARQVSARDFRPMTRIALGEFPSLEPVGEAGEFTSGTMEEAAETYRISTFGRIFGISRQAMVNDDLGAFADMSAKIGRTARAFEATQLAKLLQSNPLMGDGENVFDVAHGNLGASVVLRVDGLSAARLAMRKQTGMSGELLDIAPKYLVVSPDQETIAEQLLATIYAATPEDANVFTNLQLVVDPRLTSASRWYLAADPAQVDGMEFAYLEGEAGPQIESRNGFEVDGVQIKVRLDFGCGWIDHRGWWSSGHA